MKKLIKDTFEDITVAIVVLLVIGAAGWAYAAKNSDRTIVPGHEKQIVDKDNNGYADDGMVVTGKYSALYFYDQNDKWYLDYGDGRIVTSDGVTSVDDLNQNTLTTCDYQVQYRGSFENDAFLDTGWIKNNINCDGAEKLKRNFIAVHKTDPRYTGERPKVEDFGEDWEYHVDARSGVGNIIQPKRHVGQ